MRVSVSKYTTGIWAILLILFAVFSFAVFFSPLFGTPQHTLVQLFQYLGNFLSKGFYLTSWFIPLYFLWGVLLLFFSVSRRSIFFWATAPVLFFTASALTHTGNIYAIFFWGIAVFSEAFLIAYIARKIPSEEWKESTHQLVIYLPSSLSLNNQEKANPHHVFSDAHTTQDSCNLTQYITSLREESSKKTHFSSLHDDLQLLKNKMHSHNTSLPDKNTTDISHPITSSQSYITPNQHIDHTLVHHNTNRPTSEPSTSLNNISSADSHHKTSLANELPTPHISNEYTSATFISIEDTTLHIKKSNSPSSDAEHPYKIYKVPQTETKPEKDQNITFPYTDSDAYKEKELAPQNQINNIWGDKPLEAVPPNESLHIEHPSSEEIQNHSCYHISPQAVQHVSTSTHTYSPQEIKNIIIKLESSLKEFGIEAKVTSVHQGPSITMFEVLPAPGIKLIRISNLADNIALRLAAKSVRIVAPIPGKEAVGIEIPNKPRRIVHFGNLISSKQYQNETITLPIVLGEDIMGISQITDLTTLPHLLIAGATGSGKSVCVNSIICSLLYRCSPEQVKLIMIDPKIVELNFYNDIPHLLTPVITKPQQAFQVLQYCICEMEHRYNQLEQMGVRDIDSYNQRATHSGLLPYIVVIIDEFADLMMSSGKDMESTVSRLTAMSRAVGIHLVLATQRPSADVITGLIKANIPSRIAFMVASKIDSRIILDTAGAEKLLGQGDMLFCSPWDPHPTRIQGAYLSETEIECVVDEVKKFGSPQYIDDEIFIEEEQTYEAEGAEDPLLIQAIELVSKLQRASTSFLQRKFRIGYNRAARLIEAMENKGIVGPQNGSKPRNVFPS